jgi:EmrB/QacA subfamily drug resistance transporter
MINIVYRSEGEYMNTESTQKLVMLGLLLGILLSSMNNTIVATAMGAIVVEIGGLSSLTWITAAYMMMSAPSMLIFGKLSDMYGRKLFFIIALGLFITGSILCSTVHTMIQLIIYRAIQGFGGGALIPIAFTIIFDLFPPAQRGKFIAILGATFGLSSICGPLIGAYFTDYINWRWIFYINIPIGILSLLLVGKFYVESLSHSKQKIDSWGIGFILVLLPSLMFVLKLSDKIYKWNYIESTGIFALFILAFVIFIFIERNTQEPILALDLFNKKLFAISQVISFLYGFIFIPAVIYIPIYIQGVFTGSATQAGLTLIPLMAGTVVGTQVGSRFMTKTSYRNIMFGSGILCLIGMLMLSTLTVDTHRAAVTFYMAISGIGIGISFPVLNLASNQDLEIRRRGSANSIVMFSRVIGMSAGSAFFGTIQNSQIQKKLVETLPQVCQVISIDVLLKAGERNNISVDIINKLLQILTQSIAQIFQYATVFVVIALAFIFIMGNAKLVVSKSQQGDKGDSQCL